MARIKTGEKYITSIPVTVKKVDKDKRTLTMVASSQDVDRHGDTILQDGWDLGPYKKNPVILNSHRYDDATEVIARAKSTKIEGKGKKSKLVQVWEFAVDENPKAEIIFNLYAGGYLHASSVGFIPRKFKQNKDGSTDYFTIEEAELLEVSAVSVPANAAATLAKSIGASEDDLRNAVKVLDQDQVDEDLDFNVNDEETPSDDEDPETPEETDDEGDESEDEAGDEEDPETEETDTDEAEEDPKTDEEDPEETDTDDPEPARSVKPRLTKKQLYARAIHKLNSDQERTLKIVSVTIEKMLNGESKSVKRDYNSVIRKMLKSK